MEVSVVIPVYNEVQLVREAVQQVLSVDIADEIVIVDDGSTDGTASIVHELSQTDTRIRLIEQEHNGISRA